MSANKIDEFVVISGKGGTGKTTLTASFATLAESVVLADCDVDAADLYLILPPTIVERGDFISGNEAAIRVDDCTLCAACLNVCRFNAISMQEDSQGKPMLKVDPIACEGCAACVHVCGAKAIDFAERLTGEWYISDTDYGKMVHARLSASGENSGKLVTLVRQKAREIAERNGNKTILIDGPPGIGCPVIASVTGATKVLIITEPTCSGEHDLKRILALTKHFDIPAAVCINKWDINPIITKQIEAYTIASGAQLAGRIRYAKEVSASQLIATPVIKMHTLISKEIKSVWKNFISNSNSKPLI